VSSIFVPQLSTHMAVFKAGYRFPRSLDPRPVLLVVPLQYFCDKRHGTGFVAAARAVVGSGANNG